MPLSNHKCSLGLDSNSILPKKGALWSKFVLNMKKLSLISFKHPETFKHFRSHSTVMAEKQRQILEGGNFIIHPFSQFCLWWNSFIALINLIHMIVTTFRLCYVLNPPQPSLHVLDNVILALHCICLLDIIIKFNIGFKEEFLSHVQFDRWRIACRYFRCWFFFDIISSLPIAYILLFIELKYKRCVLVAHVLPILRGARLLTSLNDIVTPIKETSYILRHAVHLICLFIVTMHWSCCLVYSPSIFTYYWCPNSETLKAFFLNSTDMDLTNLTESCRYQKALFLCLSSFFGTSMSLYKVHNPDEYIVHSMITLYAAMFMVYSTVLILNIYITAYNSKVRYNGLINQVELQCCISRSNFPIVVRLYTYHLKAYMQHKQFPMPLKKRVRIFFNYKFSQQYYKEDDVLHCLSDQLRNEIILQTYHKFVNKVKLFEGIPPDVIGVLLSHLKSEVYLANDLVLRAGDVGSCLYFIGYGTVALYSLKGAEVCHLEDGAHFGGVALLMKDNKHIASVVAIEITQLYSLDAIHFRKYLMSNSILRERMEVLTSKRMHETVVLDETFRREQKRKRENLSFEPQSDMSKESLRSS